MKRRLISLLTLLAVLFCAAGCSKPYGDSITSVVHTGDSGIQSTATPSAEEQKEILEILNSGKWINGTADCLPEYTFTFQGRTLSYHAACGTFTDAAANRSLPLSKDEQIAVNKALGIAEDFSFSLTWNCYGVSSYDSLTGKLVKTTDAPNPDDYVTVHLLTAEEQAVFKSLINALDVNAYPDEYDPKNGYSLPNMTLVLTVRRYGVEKTVRAEEIALSYESSDPKGQAFLSTCEAISTELMKTDAWKALPDYAYYYD